MTTVEAQLETCQFQAEVKQLLHLVTNALYSKREIFLRELISNASDALEKLRQHSISDEALLESDPDLKIKIRFNKDNQTISIIDNGCGMSRQDVIDHLGTIANSGTQKFIESLSGDAKKDSRLIGQFGVGFYSAFIVAKKVVVQTRQAGMQHDQGVYWESEGTGEYQIKNIERSDRGTEVILFLKDDAKEFCEFWKLKSIVTQYSNHLQWPILMEKNKVDKDGKELDDKEEEQVNDGQALWMRPKGEVSDDEYKKFYTTVASHDFQDPLAWSHNTVEGKLEYTSLLFVPQKAPFDLFYREHQRGLKLFIQRVFILDDAEQLLPMYLRFVRGVVDSNDLPLNVSREMLQSNRTIDAIRSGCVKRVLSMLESMAKNDSDKYATFWSEFGQVLKEGVAEDFANKDRIAKLLRFASTQDDAASQTVSLEDYVGRMQEGQDKIYYLCSEGFDAAIKSPHLEIFKKKGIEVLLLTDRVDEWLVAHLTEFDGKKLQSVSKGQLDDIAPKESDEDKADVEKKEADFKSVLTQMSKALEKEVKEIKATSRLVSSASCIVYEEDQMSSHLQRMMRDAGQAVPETKPILEVNLDHALLQKLKSEQDDERFDEMAHVIFDQAVLSEGGKLADPALFVSRLNRLICEA